MVPRELQSAVSEMTHTRFQRKERGQSDIGETGGDPPYFLLNRIQGDRPAQWHGRQRLLPAKGLETHTTAVCGPSVEEVADSQTEQERVLCSGEMCWCLPSWTADSWAREGGVQQSSRYRHWDQINLCPP